MGTRWQAFVTLSVGVALVVVALSSSAAYAAIPLCKAGQKSTKAKPCKQPSSSRVAPSSGVPDPGNVAPRRDDSDAVTILRTLDASAGKYQIEVENTSGIGYINSFNWVPPADWTIKEITSTEGGHCSLAPNSVPGGGDPLIACVGGSKGIAPPKCTCLKGGRLLVNFTATSAHPPVFNGKYWTYYGAVGAYTKITGMTPVPYHIPSVLPRALVDLPLCKKGQKSTKAHPCATV